MAYYLGLDIGTSGTKTLLLDQQGLSIAKATYEYPLSQPRNGWAEQDPEDWWQAVVQGIQAVFKQSGISAQEIQSVGLTGQMHSLVMLDKDGIPIRPAILWCDQRTGESCARLETLIGREQIQRITGNPPISGFTAAKLLWVQEWEPENWRRCAKMLLAKDYIRYKLTGQFFTDVTDASGTQLMDLQRRDWSQELLEALSIPKEWMPEILESQDLSGGVSAQASQKTGLREGTPVAGGAADNSAAAVGTGVVRPGGAFTTLGTSGVVYTITDEPLVDPHGRVHTLCAPVRGKWILMSCTQAAGLSLRWFRDQLCEKEIEKGQALGMDPYQLMDALAQQVPIGAERLLYLPYLMGERSPHQDPLSRGVFFGLSSIHQKGHMIRAILEGVAFSQKECVDIFAQLGAITGQMSLCGGGAKSPLWRTIMADVYGSQLILPGEDEGPAAGAAILAAAGERQLPVEQVCREMLRPGKTQPFSQENHQTYQNIYQVYKGLYPALKQGFQDQAKL